MRKICPHCKKEVRYDRLTLEESGLDYEQYHDHPFFEGTGCKECNGMGYQGRSAIVELLELNDEMRELIIDKTVITSYSIHYTKLYETGKKIEIAAANTPKFKAGKALKDAVN